MNFKEILELIDKVAERNIGSVEIEQAGVRVKIEGKVSAPSAGSAAPWPAEARSENQAAVPQSVTASPAGAQAAAAEEEEIDPSLHIIPSPIVGTFYRAANPESPVFVNVGDRIIKGQVLCIVEAMKLMNEIESDVDGVLVRIFPQNAQPIEYGEKLFAVKL